MTVFDRYNTKLVNADTLSIGQQVYLQRGIPEITLTIDALHITPGTYNIGLWLANSPQVLDSLEEAFQIEVQPSSLTGFVTRPRNDGVVSCNFRLTHC